MRRQFKNIPIGSIITPCVKRGAHISFRKTAHLRKFRKEHGSGIVRLSDGLECTEDNQLNFWNIVKMGKGPTAFKFTTWSRF